MASTLRAVSSSASRQITRADSAVSEVNCHYPAVTVLLDINRRRVAMAPRSRDAAPIGHLLLRRRPAERFRDYDLECPWRLRHRWPRRHSEERGTVRCLRLSCRRYGLVGKGVNWAVICRGCATVSYVFTSLQNDEIWTKKFCCFCMVRHCPIQL